MATKKQRKSNAGRKPVADKKVPLVIYLRKSLIDTNGKSAIQEYATGQVVKKFKQAV